MNRIVRIKKHPRPINCPMQITYMHQKTPCTRIYVDFKNRKVSVENFTKDPLMRAFGVNESPTWEDFELFIKDRCFPETRGHIKWFLKEVGVDSYDPMQIVEKTQGRCAEDNMWLDIKYRKRGTDGYRLKRRSPY